MATRLLTRRDLSLALAATAAAGTRAARAQTLPLRINLGTLAPRGSSYFQALQRMGEQWKTQNVRLVIYPDGAQGSEADMVRLMRVGTLQAGLFTATGLTDIEPGIAGLQSYPLLFRSFSELEYVTDKLQPMFNARLAAKGFVVLFWADAGWVRYFFREAVTEAAQLKKVKSFVWAGSTEQFKIMRELGYDPVQMETADILQGIATGQITGIGVPPIYALISQFDKRMPHMLDLDYAPMVGACVVRKEAWDRLNDAQRATMLQAAAAAGSEIRQRNRAESEQAVTRMQTGGLVVHRLSTLQRAEWQKAAEQFQAKVRGRIVPADIHDEIMKRLTEFRAGKPTA